MPKKSIRNSQIGYPSVTKYLLKKKTDFFAEKVAVSVTSAQSKVTENDLQKNINSDDIETRTDCVQSKDSSEELQDNLILSDIDPARVNDKAEEKLQLTERNLKQAKQLLRKTSEINLQKDLTIKHLMAQNEAAVPKSNELLYTKFVSHFEPAEIRNIRSIGPGAKNDSKFILNIMRSLYKGDEAEKLKNRSAAGRTHNKHSKLEVSFEKKNIMEKMMTERMHLEVLADTTQNLVARTKKLNALIRYAIHNIQKGKEKSQLKRKRNIEDVEEIAGSKRSKATDIESEIPPSAPNTLCHLQPTTNVQISRNSPPLSGQYNDHPNSPHDGNQDRGQNYPTQPASHSNYNERMYHYQYYPLQPAFHNNFNEHMYHYQNYPLQPAFQFNNQHTGQNYSPHTEFHTDYSQHTNQQ